MGERGVKNTENCRRRLRMVMSSVVSENQLSKCFVVSKCQLNCKYFLMDKLGNAKYLFRPRSLVFTLFFLYENKMSQNIILQKLMSNYF